MFDFCVNFDVNPLVTIVFLLFDEKLSFLFAHFANHYYLCSGFLRNIGSATSDFSRKSEVVLLILQSMIERYCNIINELKGDIGENFAMNVELYQKVQSYVR